MLKHSLLWLALSATGLAQTLQLESGLVTRNDTLKGALAFLTRAKQLMRTSFWIGSMD